MTVDPTLATETKTSKWKVYFNIALTIALIGVFAWQLHKDWSDITAYDWRHNFQPQLAALALLLLLVCSWLDILIWNRTLGWFDRELPFVKVAPVYIWSYLARYIPGKVASLLLRVALAREVERAPAPVLAASAAELALRSASAMLIFLAALLGWGIPISHVAVIMMCIIIPVILLAAHPRLMLPAMNWVLRKMKKPLITRTLLYREVLGVIGALVIRWIVFGISFALLAWSVFPAALYHIPVLAGTAAGSWTVGFASMLPGGFGVMELMQKVILEGTLKFPTEVALVIPVFSRLWTLIAEGLWALVAVFLWRTAKISDQVPLPMTVKE